MMNVGEFRNGDDKVYQIHSNKKSPDLYLVAIRKFNMWRKLNQKL